MVCAVFMRAKIVTWFKWPTVVVRVGEGFLVMATHHPRFFQWTATLK